MTVWKNDNKRYINHYWVWGYFSWKSKRKITFARKEQHGNWFRVIDWGDTLSKYSVKWICRCGHKVWIVWP